MFNPDNNIILEIVDESDVAKYINILKLLELNPGTSKRYKNIREHFERDPILHREFKTISGDGMNSSEAIPVDFTNENHV